MNRSLWLVAILASGSALATAAEVPSGASGDWLARAQHEIEAREYQATPSGDGIQAPNRAQGLRTYFGPTGIRVHDRAAPGSPALVGMQLARFGRGAKLDRVGAGDVSHDGARVEIRRPGLVEWYENGANGLEQGFTIARRPRGAGPLVLELAVGEASARLVAGDVMLETPAGRKLGYSKLEVADASGARAAAHFDVPSPDRVRLVVDDAHAAYPLVIDPILTGVFDTQLLSSVANSLFGYSVAGAGDVNGDGYADVIVGAYEYDAGDPGEGAAFIFLGGPAGIASADSTAAATRIESNQSYAYLGVSVAGAGDVNGDGYADVIVGSNFNSNETGSSGGTAFVFLGSATGIANGNPGTAATWLESSERDASLGYSVASAGDVNGDGYADVIVGAPNYDAPVSGIPAVDAGGAFVFLGSAAGIADGTSDGAATRLLGDQAGAAFGATVASAGDVNGDGYADVIVGAWHYEAGQSDESAAFLFQGSATGVADADAAAAATQIESDEAGNGFIAVASAGDVNGDEFDDVIIGLPYYGGAGDAGAAMIFHGSATGVPSGSPTAGGYASWIPGDQAGAVLGASVASAGDVNGDGYADVIIGAPRYDDPAADEGAAFVLLGGVAGIASGAPSGTAYARLEINDASALLGGSVAGAGDVDGDGYDDVIVGAHYFGASDEGAAFVWRGGRTLGELLVLSQTTNTIARFGPNGQYLGNLVPNNGFLASPRAMAIGPGGSSIYVTNSGTNSVERFRLSDGEYFGSFVAGGTGGLSAPRGLVFRGTSLYVVSSGNNSVLRFNAQTGAFEGVFVTPGSGGLTTPQKLVFGPDGNLYVANFTGNNILRFDGNTGAFLGVFNSGGGTTLRNPLCLVFGPDGALYVCSQNSNSVLKYNGITGAFQSTFVFSGSNGLSTPQDLVFGPEGKLFVASFGSGRVLRYRSNGGFDIQFAAISTPVGLLFPSYAPPACQDGLDNDGDGTFDFSGSQRDLGCSSANDPSERAEHFACDDGKDNDSDGAIDFVPPVPSIPADPGCASPTDTLEADGVAECADGIDNDRDRLADFPSDPGCASAASDAHESPACSDGLDNDGDLAIDYPADGGCTSPAGASEIPSAPNALLTVSAVQNDSNCWFDTVGNNAFVPYPYGSGPCGGAPGANRSRFDAVAAFDQSSDTAVRLRVRAASASDLDYFAGYNYLSSSLGATFTLTVNVPAGLIWAVDVASLARGALVTFDDAESGSAVATLEGAIAPFNVTVGPNGFPFTAPPWTTAISNGVVEACLPFEASRSDAIALSGTGPGTFSVQVASILRTYSGGNEGAILFGLDDVLPSIPYVTRADNYAPNPTPGCNGRVAANDGYDITVALRFPWSCADGLDNDGDGLVDFPADPGCHFATSDFENPPCDDDLDNDGDGKIDWDGGPGMVTPDPECTVAYRNRETPSRSGGCGIGAELVLLLPLFGWAQRRRTLA